MLSFHAIAVLALLSAVTASAQQIYGTITGTVTDSTGAAVPGVSVRLSNTATGLQRTAASGEDGNFRFLAVQPGAYKVDVQHQGFKAFRRDSIVVEADRSLAVPVQLEVGAVTEVVEVQGGTPLLEPNTSSLGTVMDQRKVEELPLNGRNPLGLANLIPTVRGIGFFGGQVLSSWRLAAVSIGGGPPLANGFLVDGIASEKVTVAGTQTFLSIDSTQEFKVLTNAMSAEFGRTAGGIISIVSKGGTNEFHGNLFEFLRNNATDSRGFFAQSAPVLKQNDFGFTLGGPVYIPKIYNGKNKTFFFASYEGFRNRSGNTPSFNTVPLEEMYEGDFRGWIRTPASGAPFLMPIYDPATTTINADGRTYSRQPFANNTIPKARFSSVATKYIGFRPKDMAANL
ncbi:MAG: carboxypeptidase regulatory-like domain-containing protein, partial [Bryobacterales bacterium]|nr:carboxypeptidase regulatory-like domain-containing protein [Bryobacterales bacterium]